MPSACIVLRLIYLHLVIRHESNENGGCLIIISFFISYVSYFKIQWIAQFLKKKVFYIRANLVIAYNNLTCGMPILVFGPFIHCHSYTTVCMFVHGPHIKNGVDFYSYPFYLPTCVYLQKLHYSNVSKHNLLIIFQNFN